MDSHLITNTPPETPSEVNPPAAARPFSVTLLALGVLIITVLNLIRFVLSIRYWAFLSTRLGISPFYLALTGFIWSAAGLILVWGFWKARTWAPRLMQAVALTYAAYYWLDHLFLMDHGVGSAPGAVHVLLPANWRFSAVVTVISLGFMAWTLNRSKVKAYFGMDELQPDHGQVKQDDHS